MMTAMATTTTTTTAIRTTKGVNPMQATMPLLPMARVADPRLFTILQARRARKFGLNITCPGKIAHIFFDRLKNSLPHPDIIRTTNPKKNACIFTRSGDTDETRDLCDADRALASAGRICDIFAECEKLLDKKQQKLLSSQRSASRYSITSDAPIVCEAEHVQNPLLRRDRSHMMRITATPAPHLPAKAGDLENGNEAYPKRCRPSPEILRTSDRLQ